MLYRVVHEKSAKNIAVLGVQKRVLDNPDIFIANGNAASDFSEILPVSGGLKEINQNWDIIQSEWWNSVDGSKRKIMAECLVPNCIPADFIDTIYVSNHDIAREIRQSRIPSKISVVP